MKSIITIVGLTLSANIFSCTNFSGTFQFDESNIVTIAQQGCSSIDYQTSEDQSLHIVMDGQSRVLASQDLEIGGQKIGTATVLGSGAISNQLDLTISTKLEIQGQVKEVTAVTKSILLANGDLQSTVDTTDGQHGTAIGKRIK